MAATVQDILKSETIQASAPCRVDMGGTLDISTFYLPLAHVFPCTVNLALDLRTTVRLLPYPEGFIRVSSQGFESVAYALEALPLDHPLGLVFAVAAHFHVGGIHICIDSDSPPQSALGGSSAAAVALIGAYQRLLQKASRRQPAEASEIALLAHSIESITAGVPCGLQDQLAGVYGGVNAWHWIWRWNPGGCNEAFQRERLLDPGRYSALDNSILLAYCGIPHASKNINDRWVRQFLSGGFQKEWAEIAECSRAFRDALKVMDYEELARWMNREVDIRCRLTPDVLDETGRLLVEAARSQGCGARFCGAGGGGCIWAIGEAGALSGLKKSWLQILAETSGGGLLRAHIARDGLQY
jgi:D-glycero-alpha-D-manno-heptose-7-phosphate kinase